MAKKQVKKEIKPGVDYSRMIGYFLVGVGVMAIIMMAVILVKVLSDEKKYVISYHTDDGLAEQIVEQSELDGKPVGDAMVNTGVNYIKLEKALEIALANAGITRENAWDIDVELERKFGQVVFEVSFNSGQYEYEYYINAENGEIVKSFREVDF